MIRIVMLAAFVLACVIVGGAYVYASNTELERDKVEQPKYRVLAVKDGYEIRRYDACIVAQIELDGPEDSAMNRGFRPLAGYIFGGNVKRSEIAMTSPVVQQAVESEKVAMTSPVIQQPAPQATDDEGFGGPRHLVSFIMPREYKMDTLPVPNDERVRLREVPARTSAVIRFSGWGDTDAMKQKEQELRDLLDKDGVRVDGAPTYARYDPPWTLPNRRRNEIMLPVVFGEEASS